jgi:hypothetical protein
VVTVVDDTDKPVANALVLYRSAPVVTKASVGQPAIAKASVAAGVRTGADGALVVSQLAAGTYQLCAYGPNENHLGSCEWGSGTAWLEVTDGQAATAKLQIAEGTLLTFRVADPKGQIRDLESLQTATARLPVSGANFAIGIWAGSRYARARLVSTNGATRNYQLAIPKNAAVRLFLDTSLQVQSGAGVTAALRQQSDVLTAAGQGEMIVDLVVR